MKAIWNNQVIAQSKDTIIVENNLYSPKERVNSQYLKPSATHTTCPWKGLASYYTLEIKDQQNKDAAWYYPNPKDAAKKITEYIVFWNGVKVTEYYENL